MTLALEQYQQGNIYICCRWDKYPPHYEVIVAREYPNAILLHPIKERKYPTKEQAIAYYKRQVAKAKKGGFEE